MLTKVRPERKLHMQEQYSLSFTDAPELELGYLQLLLLVVELARQALGLGQGLHNPYYLRPSYVVTIRTVVAMASSSINGIVAGLAFARLAFVARIVRASFIVVVEEVHNASFVTIGPGPFGYLFHCSSN